MTMSSWLRMACVGCGLAALNAAPMWAQSAQPVANAASAKPAWRAKEISFRDAKPVVGLPGGGPHPRMDASVDGSVFVSVYDDTQLMKGSEVYSVSLDGEVKHLMQLMPPAGFDLVAKIDSFATQHEYVTLLGGEKYENGDRDKPIKETRYFLSLTELDGSDGKLLPLDVKFKPLKVAMFDSGGFLLLGWDEANLIPELALLKDDGSLRRFVDLDNRATDGGFDALSMKSAMKPETVELLERTNFSQFGKDVLLAQMDAAAPVHDLSAVGEDRKIPVNYPAGWVMHDVLAGPTQWTMMVRMQPVQRGKDTPQGNYQRLFEVDAAHGSLVREFTFETPSVTNVTCAPAGKIAAMYLRPVPGASQPGDAANGQKPQQTLELVVATAPR
jgi:hypothetical protein